MTLQEFYETYKGKRPDFDHNSGSQCVDLIKHYLNEVLAIAPISGNASYYLENPLSRYFEYKNNSPLFVPKVGAIAIFKPEKVGPDGHVSIVMQANLLKIVTFDNNWPVGAPCQLIQHKYSDIAGFLEKREQDMGNIYNALIDDLRALLRKYPLLTQ